ncbi:MAG TPA: ABC transporter ATP-binding protein [Bacilli bacterium]|nr:MAG: putative multidrug export ATP-binding/permease protein [Tenericutes bacterium ADurb.BinA124]HPX84485.1 ABC transporter ATP-binding protein [Bacilli bacterium]HQC74361.1 ABC transporter ATP-binding protein [Bacilli bacterium]
MFKQLRSFLPQIFLLSFFGAIIALTDIIASLKIRDLIDLSQTGDFTNFSNYLWLIAGLMIVSGIALFTFHYFKALFIRSSLTKMKQQYISRVFKKNINEFQKENNATYLSSLSNDYDQIETNFLEPIVELIFGIVNLSAGIVLFVIVDYRILLITVGLMGLNILLSTLASKPLNKHNKERSDLFASYTSYLKEVLSAFHIIKTNNLEDKIHHDFKQKSQDIQQKGFIIDRIKSFFFAAQNMTFTLIFFGLVIIVGAMAMKNAITLGAVVLIVQSLQKIIWPIQNTAEALPKIFSVKAIFQRIDNSLKNKTDYQETKDFAGFQKNIHINHLRFAYEDHLILEDINLEFEKGKKYLIVGPSGGGKSTILKLLRKYFYPEQGSILIDGIPLKDIKKEQYFSHIANVEQNVFLFEDTIRHNLTLYKEYTDEEINEAIAKAGLKDFIAKLPQGLETMIYDNGKNISGGERSRLAIARGLINQADIIFLDEAFANLDAEKAKAIEKSLLDLKDVTIINVSHIVFKEHRPMYDDVIVVKNKMATSL